MTEAVEDGDLSQRYARCAQLIGEADGLLITAGAGLGVDSGLPDFRGSEGMWRAYPALGRAKVHFDEIANPAAFESNPRVAWGFYGHRLKLYREAPPGPAFEVLRAIAAKLPRGAFVFTSNVDGHFHAAGFDAQQVCECHGSIHHLQCTGPCGDAIWPADGFLPEVDETICELRGELPSCPACGALARPNILMFGDWSWIEDRTFAQRVRLERWLRTVERAVVIEIGAGTAIPTVRRFGEDQGVPLVRINKAAAQTRSARDVSLPVGGGDAMRAIAEALAAARFFDR